MRSRDSLTLRAAPSDSDRGHSSLPSQRHMRPDNASLRAGRAGLKASSALFLMALLVSLLVGVTAPRVAHSQSSVPSAADAARTAREVINHTMSPFCPGLLLANCTSLSADSLRRAILARAEAGASRKIIEGELIAAYGESVRAAPEARGFGLVAWLTPAVLLLVAGVGTAAWVHRVTRAGGLAAGQTAAAPMAVSEPGPFEPPADTERAAELERLAELVRQDGTR